MSKGSLIVFDDDSGFTSKFKELFDDSGFDVKTFNQIEELRKVLNDQLMMKDTKALIFDLARSKSEANQSRNFVILDDLQAKFNEFRIPIIIHSAFATSIDNFKNCGTVWRIEKSNVSIERIVELIEDLDESGFLEAFTPNGSIELSLMEELHKSFTEQFREGEIEKIISHFKAVYTKDYKKRSINVFKRTAIKALLSELLSPVFDEGEKVNPIEHYYRRLNSIDFWTGDILKKKDNSDCVIVMTPRCNVASKNINELLVCEFELGKFPSSLTSSKEKEKISYALTDKPQFSGYDRYLPPSPIFDGGKINLSKFKMIPRTILLDNYERIISLSDELTNEVIGKFGAYFFRTGITPWSLDEVIGEIKAVNN